MNNVKSSNDELKAILTLLEIEGNNLTFSKFDPKDFGANYDRVDDPEKKGYFEWWLMQNGYKNIATPKDEYNIYDISAEKDGETYIFELKNRDCKSTDFGDTIIELPKYNMLKVFSNTGYKVKIVNFFEDCIHIHDHLSPHTFEDHYAQKTNNWCRDKIKKTLVSYKNTPDSLYPYI